MIVTPMSAVVARLIVTYSRIVLWLPMTTRVGSPLIFQILRGAADGGELGDAALLADVGLGLDDHMGADRSCSSRYGSRDR